jgi:hypothetical protein
LRRDGSKDGKRKNLSCRLDGQSDQENITPAMGIPVKVPDEKLPYTSDEERISGRVFLSIPKNLSRKERKRGVNQKKMKEEMKGKKHKLAKLIIPRKSVKIHEHSAAGIGDISHKRSSLRTSGQILFFFFFQFCFFF